MKRITTDLGNPSRAGTDSNVFRAFLLILVMALLALSCAKGKDGNQSGLFALLGLGGGNPQGANTASYALLYDGNGATSGSVPFDSTNYTEGQNAVVLTNMGSLARTGYFLTGWNTQADGTGLIYRGGDSLTMGASQITLYGIWVTAPAGLVGEWRFSGNANDSSGNAHNGIVTGATLESDRLGRTNMAYHFDGIDDKIEVAHHAQLNLTTAASISMWVNLDEVRGSYFLNKPYSYTIGVPNPADYLLYSEFFGSAGGWKSTGLLPSIGAWHHLAVTYNGTQRLFYVDGVLVATHSVSSPISTSTYNLGFGEVVNDLNAWYKGYLDDIRIYNISLTSSQVQTLYHEDAWR